ncbi:hypothetical protein BDF19DRAFT_431476 [Syncephalis fuscata]|nr:hypothetical protein BDF19DRAFT_431476 [Syncephalis fuscata]
MAVTLHSEVLLEQLEWLKQTEWLAIDDDTATRLSSLAETHPTRFYRPLLSCVTANKVSRVATDLGQLIHLSNLLRGNTFFFTNLDLATTVLASEPPQSNGSTLGQYALILEYTLRIGELKRSNTMSKTERARIAAFLLQLEHRISVMLVAREATQRSAPISLLVLLVGLLSEIRHVVRAEPLSRPNWLDLIVKRVAGHTAVTEISETTANWSTVRSKLARVYDRLSRTGISMEEASMNISN